MNPSREDYDRIAGEIASTDSVVGIDAKKTHVLIIHLLEDIQRRLERLERLSATQQQAPETRG